MIGVGAAGGLAFHPDGKALAVSDSANRRDKNWSGGVLLVARDTGKVVRELPTPGTSASRIRFSSDGRWLAAVSGAGIRVWGLRHGEEVAGGTAGHQGMFGQVAAVRGGLIATASDDHTVRLWDAATGEERRRFGHGHWVRAVALSPDGRLLVSSRLWCRSGVGTSDLPELVHRYSKPGSSCDDAAGDGAVMCTPTPPGVGRQFGGNHRRGANVVFADGSVRFVEPSIAPVCGRRWPRVAAKEIRNNTIAVHIVFAGAAVQVGIHCRQV
jgi:prepilin-type processing-associated H-X9-DG protein